MFSRIKVVDINFGFDGLKRLYDKDPNLLIRMLDNYFEDLNIHSDYIIDLYNYVENSRHKSKIKKAAVKRVNELLNNKNYRGKNLLNNTSVAFIDGMLHQLDSEIKEKYFNAFVETFAWKFNLSSRSWKKSRYDVYSNSHMNKTQYVELAEKYIDSGDVCPLTLLSNSLDNLSHAHAQRLVKLIPEGRNNKKLKRKLRESRNYFLWGFSEEDLSNTISRRAFLRKLVRDNRGLGPKIPFKVVIPKSDVEALSGTDRWYFLRGYYRWNGSIWSHSRLRPKGFGRKIKLESDFTADEVETLLFPLTIKNYDKKANMFITSFRRYEKERKLK